jgi:hypothetical protein
MTIRCNDFENAAYVDDGLGNFNNVGIHLTQVTPTGCSFASVFRTIDA